jgi:adenosylcobinamide kinase/adenosylcobinamide-phosphate guanylyltransferase
MKKVFLILGGARSGKSRYAVKLAKDFKKRVAFIATCVFPDKEMMERIKKHRCSRPRHWKLIEEGKDIGVVLVNLQNKYDVVLVDCLGLWISNLLADNLEDKEIEKRIEEFFITISKIKNTTILVSNEVGSGIVPENPLARRFRDLVGLVNQMLAKKADEVIFMHAGMPLIIKGGKGNAKIRWNNKKD